MKFNAGKFQSAKFSAREEEVPVPELAEFFEGEGAATWKVRGLQGEELAQANEAVSKNKTLSALAEAMDTAGNKERVKALKEIIGVSGDKSPDDHVKRLELLVLGSVEPQIDKQAAVKLAMAFPLTFTRLTNTVMRLTGEGAQMGKPGGSGKTPESGPPLASATSGGDSSSK